MSQHDNKQKLFGNFSWFPAFSQEHLPPHKCGMEKASNYGSFSRFHRTSTHLKIAWTIWTCLTSSTLHRRISYICLTLKAELKTPPGSPTPSVGFQFVRFFFFFVTGGTFASSLLPTNKGHNKLKPNIYIYLFIVIFISVFILLYLYLFFYFYL